MTGPERRAVGIRYVAGDFAPRVIAKARGRRAGDLERAAESLGVPIVEDEQLATTLEILDVGSWIPTETYDLVARLLVFVHAVETRGR